MTILRYLDIRFLRFIIDNLQSFSKIRPRSIQLQLKNINTRFFDTIIFYTPNFLLKYYII